MSVGSRIKELREAKKISRNELADIIGVTVGAISNYENEVSSPKEPILFKIMAALNCDANYLFQDSIDMPSMNDKVSAPEYKIIEKYRDLDDHGKDMVDVVLEKEYDRCHSAASKTTAFPQPQVNAAHQRTDIEIPAGVDTSDNDIMDDENFRVRFIEQVL
jgi:transcriptional regulator with XRE-family HTH domain